MWYKEHFKIQAKLWLVIPLFIFADVVAVISHFPYTADNEYGKSLFEFWSQLGLVETLTLAALFGADSVSEEDNHNTLSFLLSRPLRREHIFNSKFAFGALIMTGCQLVSVLVIIGLDRIPRTTTVGYSAQELPQKMVNFSTAFELSLLMWLAGLMMLGLTMLLSIRTRNTLHTMMITFGLAVVIAIPLSFFPGWNGNFRGFLDIAENFSLPIAGGLAGLALAFYLAGFRMFRQQEF